MKTYNEILKSKELSTLEHDLNTERKVVKYGWIKHKDKTLSLELLFQKEPNLIKLVHDITTLHDRYEKQKIFYSSYNKELDYTTVLCFTNFGDYENWANLKIEKFKGCGFVEGRKPFESYFCKKGFNFPQIKTKEDFVNYINSILTYR